jgi:glycosyltransferase involved in cell wall biosynthesis
MTKILVNLHKLKNLNCGLGQVALNMGKYLSQLPNANDYTFIVPKGFTGYFGNKVKYTELNGLNKYISFSSERYDILHLTHQMSSRFAARYNRMILTIHDLNFMYEKKSERKRNKYLKKVQKRVDKADALIYISNFAKEISNKFLNIPSTKTQRIIYNGVEIDTETITERPDYLPAGEFLFTIGEVMAKKNFSVLIPFLKKLPHSYNLIIAGKSTTAYAEELKKRIRGEGLENKVIMPGMIPEDDKLYLYRHCKAFVFPSLYEGFGLPVIEAMRFGKPVFISTSTSLPEIGGDLAFYWEDFDPDSMANVFEEKMQVFNSDINYPDKLKKYSTRFTWKENIDQYNKLYQEIAKRP